MNMFMKKANSQSGAALVVSMVLLMVLTLLAISTMRTASLEITMAGNQQYAENAFQLAETASDEYVATAVANANCANTLTPGNCDIASTDMDIDGVAYGSYQATNDFVGDTDGCPGGFSEGTFATYHFEVQTDGQSASRNARSQHTQGWTVCRNK